MLYVRYKSAVWGDTLIRTINNCPECKSHRDMEQISPSSELFRPCWKGREKNILLNEQTS